MPQGRDPRFPPVGPLWGRQGWPFAPTGQTLPAPGAFLDTERARLIPSGGGGEVIPQGELPRVRSPGGGVPPIWVALAHQYARNIIQLVVSVPNGASTPAAVLESPTDYRNFLQMRNTSATANVFVAFGRFATQNDVLRLEPNVMVLYDMVVPQDDIYMLADDASATCTVEYSTIALPPMTY